MSFEKLPNHPERKITIGITCFNAVGTIERALKSALAQDWPNHEIVVVDDVSTDGSWQLIQEFARSRPRIKALRHAVNGGAAAARNTILENATGEFVAFFDDDDESLPARVRTQYETLLAHERSTGVSMIACYASGVRRYANGYELQMPAIGSEQVIPAGPLVADYLLFNARQPGVFYGAGTPTCALMARLSTFRALGGFDSSLRRVEDVDLAVRLALNGGHFIGCPEVLFVQHATFSSDKAPQKNLEAELRLLDKHADYLKQRNRFEYAKDWFRIRFYHFNKERFKFLLALTLFLIRHPFIGTRHLLRSVPSRFRHEKKMQALER